jgi:hypothetical protein
MQRILDRTEQRTDSALTRETLAREAAVGRAAVRCAERSSTNGTPYQAALRPCDVLGDEAITGFRATLRDATQKIITLNGRQDALVTVTANLYREDQALRALGHHAHLAPLPGKGRTLTNHAEKITNRSQSPASRAEMRHPLRQRTVPNNGVVPQQGAMALRLLIAIAAASPSEPALAAPAGREAAA